MSSTKMFTPVIAPGGTIVVTGVNGLIGSLVADLLLERGYAVRGVVRDVEKSQWLSEYLAKKYEHTKFELVSVPDLAVEGCFDEALKGASGFIHLASPLGGEAPDIIIPKAVNINLNVMKAAAKASSIKRVVVTSSALAASYPSINVKKVVDQSSFNDESVEDVQNNSPTKEVMALYVAIKVSTERACWDWVRENKPDFDFNTILPYVNFGKLMVPEKQGEPSTIAWAKAAFDNNEMFAPLSQGIKPQWFISTRDCALLHVAALLHPSIISERIFGYAEKWDFNKLLAIMREAYPDRKFADDVSIAGEDMVEVPRERAEEVLGWVKNGQGWDGLGDSIREMIAQWA
ncbi:unnamed protein product [Periconia digitata]|uniref:NAD-dependent epimerase/dehydratase domain-containing protein n=1 Tax=Periconia digitata TaxID=1303443 RepID=A0A9W4XW06_9PLEO|nr:unnamed protein product [Periconia digitata]